MSDGPIANRLGVGVGPRKARFVAAILSALLQAGIDAKLYSGQSFGIGAATTAALCGIPDSLIKVLGRWQSSAYQLYIRTDTFRCPSRSGQAASVVTRRMHSLSCMQATFRMYLVSVITGIRVLLSELVVHMQVISVKDEMG